MGALEHGHWHFARTKTSHFRCARDALEFGLNSFFDIGH
jgi:hypothetical protein